ncbi:MAG: hypothetical protein ACM3RX_08580 [Methanococcaceae archaeon]
MCEFVARLLSKYERVALIPAIKTGFMVDHVKMAPFPRERSSSHEVRLKALKRSPPRSFRQLKKDRWMKNS